MEGEIQYTKIDREEIRSSLYMLAWLPVFAFIWYLFIKSAILGIQAILYPIKLTPLVLLLKLIVAFLVMLSILTVLGGISCYYDIIKRLIQAYKNTHKKL